MLPYHPIIDNEQGQMKAKAYGELESGSIVFTISMHDKLMITYALSNTEIEAE